MEFVFWFSLVMIGYAYFGYPLLLALLFLWQWKPVGRDEACRPFVSLIVTVHNEQDRIQEKIDNTLALTYPAEKREILFASDASTDRTEEIIRACPGVRLVRSPERRGKEFAQKCAVDQAAGEILVFSDVATMLEPDGLENIVASFADPGVGCVSSEDRLISTAGGISGEGVYVRYEMFLRKLESGVGSLVGLSGSFFAARREICLDWAVDLPSDFNTLFNTVKQGLRGICDPRSRGWYADIADEKKEFDRKVRTVVRGMSAFWRHPGFLNPVRYGIFAWQLFSHKLCRWLVPFFLLAALAANAFLAGGSLFYGGLLSLQIAFYLLAALYFFQGAGRGPFPLSPLLKFPGYFLSVNGAIFMAWIKFLRGDRAVFWNPSRR